MIELTHNIKNVQLGEVVNNLKSLRKSKGLTQDKLGNELGISKRTIVAWEKEERDIPPKKAQILADFFNVTVGYILGYSEYKSTDDYFKKIEPERDLNIDVLNSIGTIGEKNLPIVYDFFKKEFIKEYSKIPDLKDGKIVDGWSLEESVKVAMDNVTSNLWGLPDSVVKLILYWATLTENDREYLLNIIISLSKTHHPSSQSSKKFKEDNANTPDS